MPIAYLPLMAGPKKKRTRRRKRKGHYHTGTHVSTKTGQSCNYRSGWELAYMKNLDADVNVTSWRYEDIRIPYVSNVKTGKVRGYWPDFLVTFADGTDQLVEIKPAKRVKQAKVQKKLEAAKGWCREHGASLVVITEVELRGLGLLK